MIENGTSTNTGYHHDSLPLLSLHYHFFHFSPDCCCVVLFCAVLCCAVLCCVVLLVMCCAVLCCVVLLCSRCQKGSEGRGWIASMSHLANWLRQHEDFARENVRICKLIVYVCTCVYVCVCGGEVEIIFRFLNVLLVVSAFRGHFGFSSESLSTFGIFCVQRQPTSASAGGQNRTHSGVGYTWESQVH
jgi:hypothetical protein